MRTRFLALTAAVLVAAGACGNAGDGDSTEDTKAPGQGSTSSSQVSEQDLTTFIPNSSPGVDDDAKQIRVAVITAKTNPIGGKYAQLADGIQLFFDKVNDAGGIYGRELVIVKERDDVTGLKNQDEVRASLAEDNAFATFVATVQFAGAPLLDQAGQPTFIWNINPEKAGHPNIFGNNGALCFGCIGKAVPWLAKQLGRTKLGVLAYGVSASSTLCAAGTRDSFEKHAPEIEVAFFDDTLEFSADVTAQVAEMKDKGVDFVSTCMDTNQVFKLQTEMKKQGLDAIQYLPNAYDHDFLEENGDLFEGQYLLSQYVPWEVEPQSEATKEYLAAVEASDVNPVELTQVGWILAQQFYDGLVLAGPEFTKSKVIDGLNSQTAWTAGGLNVPIDWTRQHEDPAENPDKRGDECVTILKIENRKFVPQFNEPGKPWICFDSASETLDEPVAKSFAPDGVG
jgi:ABC-type branched-subunit amino acid transport system substrate-binding protein